MHLPVMGAEIEMIGPECDRLNWCPDHTTATVSCVNDCGNTQGYSPIAVIAALGLTKIVSRLACNNTHLATHESHPWSLLGRFDRRREGVLDDRESVVIEFPCGMGGGEPGQADVQPVTERLARSGVGQIGTGCEGVRDDRANGSPAYVAHLGGRGGHLGLP